MLFVFLRAVNLGARNKVPMKALVSAIDAAKLGQASYLLQSGNLIFAEGEAGISTPLEALILEQFGVETVAITRTGPQLEALMKANPFDAPEGGSVQIGMWDNEADDDAIETLKNSEFPGEKLHFGPAEIYLRFDSGVKTAKLSNAFLERRLKVPATFRNVKTLVRLLDKSPT